MYDIKISDFDFKGKIPNIKQSATVTFFKEKIERALGQASPQFLYLYADPDALPQIARDKRNVALKIKEEILKNTYLKESSFDAFIKDYIKLIYTKPWDQVMPPYYYEYKTYLDNIKKKTQSVPVQVDGEYRLYVTTPFPSSRILPTSETATLLFQAQTQKKSLNDIVKQYYGNSAYVVKNPAAFGYPTTALVSTYTYWNYEQWYKNKTGKEYKYSPKLAGAPRARVGALQALAIIPVVIAALTAVAAVINSIANLISAKNVPNPAADFNLNQGGGGGGGGGNTQQAGMSTLQILLLLGAAGGILWSTMND